VASSAGYTFIQERGLSGLDGLLAYWRAHADLCGAIVDRLDVPKLVLDVDTDDWPERRRRICDFVDVPFGGETFPETAELARMAGSSVFDLESWPVRLSFDDDATGHVRAFHCSGPPLAWIGPSGVFERIA
jgi:hypothetical protein